MAKIRLQDGHNDSSFIEAIDLATSEDARDLHREIVEKLLNE